MAQPMIIAHFSYSIESDELSDWYAAPVQRGKDDDFLSSEAQRDRGVGPDYDPDYFDKLDAFLEDSFGPLGEFKAA